MPEDAHPDLPDGDRGGARRTGSPMRSLPPKPETPAEVVAAEAIAGADAAATARAPKRPAKAKRAKVAPTPGPPPPLPPELVIPPKPPLPPVEDIALPPAQAFVPEPTAAAESAVVETSPELVRDAEPALAPAFDPSSEPALEPEPEPILESAPHLVAEPASAVVAPLPATVPAEPEADDRTLDVPSPDRPAEPALSAPRADAPPAEEFGPDVLVAASVDTGADALVVKGITKAFGETRAVDGIDLTVPAGIFYGLVGPNGAGKTTTLSMIAGLLRPDRGAIRVSGVDAASDPLGAKRQMGVLPDRLRTFDRLTGRQLLHYYGVLRGLPSAVVESRTKDLARAFDLSDALGRAVSDYSAGMTKKVMLAGAMIHSPRLLVLDEPFESVDPVSSAIILDILKTYVSHGGTVILSSHGMDLVERVCSRVAVIVAGQVLAEGTIDEVRGELTLEQRFIELAGGLSDVEGLEWLHTFSD
ncbi:MAG TPA: ATP-binding cassette domain-containing protein [Microbacterium sp.]|nr:ATP-binding cassette domain-containing protein [Microbacterium sp.]